MPRKPYDFKTEKTTGEETHFSPDRLMGVGGSETNLQIDPPYMCPYTDMIPLLYLLTHQNYMYYTDNLGEHIRKSWNVRNNNPNKQEKFSRQWDKRIFSAFISRNLGTGWGPMKELTTRDVETWLNRDDSCGLQVLNSDFAPDRNMILDGFSNNKTIRFSQGSYSGAIAPYSLFLDESGGRKPHVLAIVLPENYLYVKYHLLVHNTIPLDRVIVLINKELDEVGFQPPAFRRLYKEILPKIMKSSCQVWKVPREYIDENCFLDSYKLKSSSILERRKEIEQVVDEFYNTFSREQETPPYVEYTGGPITEQYSVVGADASSISIDATSITSNFVYEYPIGAQELQADSDGHVYWRNGRQVGRGIMEQIEEAFRQSWIQDQMNMPYQEGEIRVDRASVIEEDQRAEGLFDVPNEPEIRQEGTSIFSDMALEAQRERMLEELSMDEIDDAPF